LILITIL